MIFKAKSNFPFRDPILSPACTWDPVNIPQGTNVAQFLPVVAPVPDDALRVVNDDTVGVSKAARNR